MDRIVLDSSAVLTLILEERGGERLDALLDSLDSGSSVQVYISSVNWCEILTRLHRDHEAMSAEDLASLLAGVELVAFDGTAAELAAGLIRSRPALSLGDRACLALAASRKAVAWTTDKLWARFDVGVKVEVLR